MYCSVNGGNKLNITDSELKIYRLLPLSGLLLLVAAYLFRWKIDEPDAIIALALNSMPNFCAAIILPFLTLLVFNKYKPRFLIKHKAKIFYSTMPLITGLFIVMEIKGLHHTKHASNLCDMIMSIAGMLICIVVFETLNKPVVLTSYKDIIKTSKHAS